VGEGKGFTTGGGKSPSVGGEEAGLLEERVEKVTHRVLDLEEDLGRHLGLTERKDLKKAKRDWENDFFGGKTTQRGGERERKAKDERKS